jgi:hypothetical protein
MLVLLAPQLPLAYLAARAAVARARRGDVPEWRGPWPALRRVVEAVRHRRRAFRTPAEAQRWSEWRQHGWSLPVWVGLTMPWAAWLLFLADDTPAFVAIGLASMLLSPPILASFVGIGLGRAGRRGTDAHGLPPFLATRPLTSAALVAGKLRMALLSTLAAWLLVACAVPLSLSLSETWPVVEEGGRRLRHVFGTDRTAAAGLLILAALVAVTWKRLVVSMYVGLTGRSWLVRIHQGATVALLIIAVPVADWILGNRAVQLELWRAAPWVAGVLVGLKIVVAGWTTARLDATRLLSRRTLLGGAACWLGAVTALSAVLVWVAAPWPVPRHLILLVAMLAVPLVRLAAAPLALAWNRHR